MEIATAVLLKYLNDELAVDTSSLDEDSPLFSSGVIDSFSLVSLLTSIESQWGFRIPSTDVTLENFDTISRITAYVSRMTTAGVRAD
jgi:acyl carrier protein